MRSANVVKPMEAWQRRSIFAMAGELGLKGDNGTKHDQLHEMVESITGKSSIGKLTFDEAQKVIQKIKTYMRGCERLEENPVHLDLNDRWNLFAFGLKERSGMASLGQLNFIRAMMFELKKRDPSEASLDKRLRGWLEKFAKTSDVQFLTPRTARRVIEGLKAYLVKLGWEYKEI